ncbi:hypothetical protein BU14_0625s0006 [Porphyra umbilicalis]|uniref:Uncharacterized protein n=1 Tax=Porphyra umbilicalis TaxID=2786 RepID=A0A1X6NR35_PORUM|nr:hypothetical protein BU14_0625s0006 [Porphyra umbilicalis]|eukprot:OSX70956.1 hypothetical protein BU14_0625s0006 [Porphyra umbilicalis]
MARRQLPVMAALAAAVAATATATATPACTPHSVPVHAILEADGGVYTLPDGRELTAAVHSVGGCKTRRDAPTGSFLPVSAPFTILGQSSGPPCTLAATAAGGPTFAAFQAITVAANGFAFAPTFVVEDIDAGQPDETRNATETWREAAAVLGRTADGELVRPDVALHADTLLAVADVPVSGAALAALGWAGHPTTPAVTATYASWREVVNLVSADAQRGRVAVTFSATPVEQLVVLYALSQAEAAHPHAKSGVFLGNLTIPCGCTCAPRPEASHRVLVPHKDASGAPTLGCCMWMSSTSPAYVCDFRGTTWCDERPAVRYVALGDAAADGTVACAAEDMRIHVGVGGYAAAPAFRAGRAAPVGDVAAGGDHNGAEVGRGAGGGGDGGAARARGMGDVRARFGGGGARGHAGAAAERAGGTAAAG